MPRGAYTPNGLAEHERSAAAEVRVALALNGGVSLAVWIGGVVAEIDASRRARDGGGEPSAEAYRALGEAFDCRLVIDVITGSSAGGINGALLGAAMTHNRALTADYLRDRWIKLADFVQLLQPLSVAKPASLMDGDAFREDLRATFDHLCEAPLDTGRPAPSLDITATHFHGREVTARDEWKKDLRATDHRARFSFRHHKDYAAGALTDAARATASFPLAFEPAAVGDAAALAGLDRGTWVFDGGVLDNAPIRAALEAIPRQPASGEVRRHLCYVNGDPPPALGAEVLGSAPEPAAVIGAVIALPRSGPLAENVEAIRELRGRSSVTVAEMGLLGVDPSALRKTAQSLFKAYAARRKVRSVTELTDDDRHAQELENGPLPWIPTTLSVSPRMWGWGIGPALRVHHLMLDVLRSSIENASMEDRDRMLAARKAISERAAACSAEMALSAAKYRQQIAQGLPLTGDTSDWLLAGLQRTHAEMAEVADCLGAVGGSWAATLLRGRRRYRVLPARPLDAFLNHMVQIEVVRRAFADDRVVDDGQSIAFAQITPATPAPVFGSLGSSYTDPHAKLCGTSLHHFGGFYRASWRVNDFMWGRLDGAAHVVGMLFPEKGTVDDRTRNRAAARLALFVGSMTEAEILGDLNATGERTRAACTELVQRAILAEELGGLVEKANDDVDAGASPHRLGFTAADVRADLGNVIRQLSAGETLACRLGRNSPREAASDLGIRTISRTLLVSMGLLGRVNAPFAGALRVLQPLLLSTSAAVARQARYRIALLGAYLAAAMLIANRLTSTDYGQPVGPGSVRRVDLLVLVVMLLVVLGTCLVPAYVATRAFARSPVAGGGKGRRHKARAVRQALWAIILFGAGVGASVVITASEQSPRWPWVRLLAGAGSNVLPSVLSAGVLFLGLGSISYLPRLLRAGAQRCESTAWWRHGSLAVCLLVTAYAITYAGSHLWGDAFPLFKGWRSSVAVVSTAGPLIVGGAYLLARRPMVNWWMRRFSGLASRE